MLDVTDYGAVGDGVTDDGPAFRAAIADIQTFIADHPIGFQPSDAGDSIYIPPTRAAYRIVGTLNINRPVRLFSDFGMSRHASAALIFDIDGSNPTAGMVVSQPTIMQNLYIWGGDDGLNVTSGIIANRTVCLQRCSIIGFGSHGVEIDGSSDDNNANSFKIEDCWFENNLGWGLYVHGNNSNGGLEIGNSYISNLLGGVYDSAFLGMTHIAPLAEANGSVTSPGQNPDVNAFKSDGSNNSSVWIGAYSESGQNVLSFHDQAIVIGGINMEQTWGASTGMLIRDKNLSYGFAISNELGSPNTSLSLGKRTGEILAFSGGDDGDEVRLNWDNSTRHYELAHPGTATLQITGDGNALFPAGVIKYPRGFVLGSQNRQVSRTSYPVDEGTDPPPFGGTWRNGDRIITDDPQPGGYSGWVRIGGVWKGFGLIES